MEYKASENLSNGQLLHPESTEEPHVLLFPFPEQGHMSAFFKLAELLCLADLKVTFLVIEQVHARLVQNPDYKSRFARYPRFQLESISDGRNPSDPPPRIEQLREEWFLLMLYARPVLERMLFSDDHKPKFSCFIADGIMGFPIDVANAHQIPVIAFHTYSAAATWITVCIPELRDMGKIPYKGDGDDTIDCIKGVEGVLRVKDMVDDPHIGPEVVNLMIQTDTAQGSIFNTFEDLEGPILSQIRARWPNIYAIGPLHKHLTYRLSRVCNSTEEVLNNSHGIWNDDKSCMSWLDAQPLKSVVYVSFGSIVQLEKDEFLELWHGLIESGNRFLWVMRPNLVLGANWGDQLPLELIEEAKGRACIVPWAPQTEVLAHPATGSFMTQFGWNSTLETIVAGVPVIGWPYLSEQYINGRLTTEKYKTGLMLKDYSTDRHTIAGMVNDVMDKRKDEFIAAASSLATFANKGASEGGSSYNDFNSLVDYIRSACLQAPTKR